ncbi:hypothetical protein CRYUN_Cryun31cG0120800 [Craigia yunnanensis]
MESLSSSMFISILPETYPFLTSSSSCLIKAPNKQIGSVKFNYETSHFMGFVSKIYLTRFQMKGDLNHNKSSKKDVDKLIKVETPVTIPHGSGASGDTRAGLFRTPISGGVQSATSAHGLPRPALAVRNLMEQVKAII